jgi:hypothetical protein
MAKYYRSIGDVHESALLPAIQLGEVANSTRLQAILDVLRRLRDADFQALEESYDSFDWFLPEDLGMVVPFPGNATDEEVWPEDEVEHTRELRGALNAEDDPEGGSRHEGH